MVVMRSPHPSRRRSIRGGFTFVEVILSVFLVSCLAGIVTAAMPVATLSRSKAENSDRAVALAQKEMESVRGVGYANLTGANLLADDLIDSTNTNAAGAFSFTDVDAGVNDSAGATLASGTGTVLVEQADTELRRVTVTVGWTERGRARAYSLSTLVANL